MVAAGQEVFWRRGHPRSQHSGWWVRELPPVLQPFACGSQGRIWKRWGPQCCTLRSSRYPSGYKALLPEILPDLGAASHFPQVSWSRALQQPADLLPGQAGGEGSPPGSACSAPAIPVPFSGRGQAGGCLAPWAGMRRGDLDARAGAGKGTGVFVSVQQNLPGSRPGLTETLVAVGFGYFFFPFFPPYFYSRPT